MVDIVGVSTDGYLNMEQIAVRLTAYSANAVDLQNLGGGKIAYIRAIRSEDLPRIFPDAPSITPGLNLFALLSADGTPLMLTDKRESAQANAWENELQTVSVH